MRGVLTAACAAAFATAAITFTADVSTTTGPLNKPILDCVGSGHGALALREDYRSHLRAVQRDINFAHVRGHGLLTDDLSTYLDGGASLFNLFSVFDFYLGVGIRPIFELSFMPEALALDPTKTIMHYKGITSTARDMGEWAAFIAEVFQGLVQRYGVDEVRRWQVEVWNEPQGCGFFCPRPGQTNQAGYFELYNYTARAIKSVDQLIPVGGPATAALAWIADFINFTQAGRAVPADFVSSHRYPTDNVCPNCTRTLFDEDVATAAAVVAAAGLPFVMTETSAGLSNQAYDAPFAAAFVAHTTAALLGNPNISTASVWTLSDIFEEPGFQSTPWNQKFGMQTVYGVPKPLYRGLQLIRMLADTGIPVQGSGSGAVPAEKVSAGWEAVSRARGAAAQATATVGNVDVITAVDASLRTTVVLHALVTNYNYNGKNAEDPTTGLPVADEGAVSVTFTGFPANAVLPANATLTLIDATHSNAKAVWLASGSPVYPSAAEVQAELDASQLQAMPLPVSIVGTSGGGRSVTIALPVLVPYATGLVVYEYGMPPEL